MRNAARELDHFETARHFAARIGKHLAMLRGDDRRELVRMLLDEVAELEHHAGAGEGRGRGPFGERLRGCFDGGIDIGGGAHTNFSRELTDGGIEHLAEVVVVSVHLRAADKMRDGIHASFSRERWLLRKPVLETAASGGQSCLENTWKLTLSHAL